MPTTVASPTTQPKKRIGRGVVRISACTRPVARSAANAAPRAYQPVLASPQVPAPLGASTATSKTPRPSRIPATAIKAATAAVAAPPAHSLPALTVGLTGPAGSLIPVIRCLLGRHGSCRAEDCRETPGVTSSGRDERVGPVTT